jgi:hypothetical protein
MNELYACTIWTNKKEILNFFNILKSNFKMLWNIKIRGIIDAPSMIDGEYREEIIDDNDTKVIFWWVSIMTHQILKHMTSTINKLTKDTRKMSLINLEKYLSKFKIVSFQSWIWWGYGQEIVNIDFKIDNDLIYWTKEFKRSVNIELTYIETFFKNVDHWFSEEWSPITTIYELYNTICISIIINAISKKEKNMENIINKLFNKYVK